MNAKFTMACDEHVAWVTFIITDNVSKPPAKAIPHKICRDCNGGFPIVTFLKSGAVRADGYYHLQDGPACATCQPPDDIKLHFDKRGLKMRAHFRNEAGQPMLLWDESSARWKNPNSFGWRWMNRRRSLIALGGNGHAEIRLQPYTKRS